MTIEVASEFQIKLSNLVGEGRDNEIESLCEQYEEMGYSRAEIDELVESGLAEMARDNAR